ncbi:topoisomerase DNA-binding C4 zinc finger domain-containing protein, partial [Candidatus Dojkabacteria bacterium]|nr:topoisomerase DNA-binding C4 zinc finger domain-containing protein [Candidatus Dojkabacteria bacterium]
DIGGETVGLITYMRTDSLHMASQAVAAARKHIEKSIGKEYLPDKPIFYKTKQKVAQEAHEAIRPTDFTADAGKLGLSGDQERLYSLIRARALASQMNPAILDVNSVQVTADKYILQATAKAVVFAGYLKVYPEKVSESELPKLAEGQIVYPKYIACDQHFTQPPARFSEASLIKELERLGIGRPSTYAPIIHTIQARQYVEKLGSYFTPTDTGRVVTDLLVNHFGDIVDVGFTAEMEDHLDEIANGELDWQQMLRKFYDPFAKNLDQQEEKIKRADYTVLADAPADIKCPDCGGKMQVKLGRYGRFYSCAKFPDCKGMRSISGETEEDIAAKVKDKEFKEMYLDAPKTDDGRDYVLKSGRFGEFWAHPDYPKVKDARPLELQPDKLEELYGKPPRTDDNRPYLLKSGRFGKFWA